MANFVNSMEVANAKVTLKELHTKAKIGPLSPAEMKIGRRAALLLGEATKEKARRSTVALNQSMIKQYKKRGYTDFEAREALRVEKINETINNGFGTSQRCRFVWL